MLPQECREAFLVQTTHPYFQLTKHKRVERCTRQLRLVLARKGERDRKSVCVCVCSCIPILKRTNVPNSLGKMRTDSKYGYSGQPQCIEGVVI